MNEDRCVVCGEYVSEGRMVCHRCEFGEPSFDAIKMKVLLNKVTDVKEFVDLATKCRGDITVGSGRFAVDAKSIMGLFSLDLTKPLQVQFYGDVSCETIEGMKKFIVD